MNSAYALRGKSAKLDGAFINALRSANDGNISVRMQDDRILCTPTV